MTDLEKHALNIRRNVVKMVHEAKCGHPGGSLGCADIVTYLYFKEMNINKDNIKTVNRDRFVLSKGHCAPTLYATLSEKGLLDEDLLSLRKIGSKLQGHPNMNLVDGVDMSTGSLGQGISAAVGMAIAEKLKGTNNRIYCLCGDGECEEGEVWEASMCASHYKLDNLCVIVDHNGLQIDGNIEDVAGLVNLKEKFASFGYNVIEIDGHNFDEIEKAFNSAKEVKGKPTLIYMNTIKGKGVSYMENAANWHGVAPNDEEFKIAMEELKEID